MISGEQGEGEGEGGAPRVGAERGEAEPSTRGVEREGRGGSDGRDEGAAASAGVGGERDEEEGGAARVGEWRGGGGALNLSS